MIQANNKRLTVKQYLKQHPEKFLLTGTNNKGIKIYVCEAPAGSGLFAVGITDKANEAIQWSSLDNIPTKQNWHIAKTGIKDLKFVEIINLSQE